MIDPLSARLIAWDSALTLALDVVPPTMIPAAALQGRVMQDPHHDRQFPLFLLHRRTVQAIVPGQFVTVWVPDWMTLDEAREARPDDDYFDCGRWEIDYIRDIKEAAL